MQNQLPLFLPYDQVHALPIVRKSEKIFAELDLSHISKFNRGIGANGNSQHALLRAFLIRSLGSLNTVSGLIRFLPANPALIYLCGFRQQTITHDSKFYRFLKLWRKVWDRNYRSTCYIQSPYLDGHVWSTTRSYDIDFN